MRIVRERKQQCPVYANVVLREDLADTRLPAHGVPEQIACCAQEVDGSEKAPVLLQGPATRAPEVGNNEQAGDESEEEEEESENEHAGTAAVKSDAEAHLEVAEASIAVDPIHDVKPVKLMQALQANICALQSHAATIVRNEKQARIASKDGVLQPVADEGGRQILQSLILDMQSTARCFDDRTQATVERAVAESDARLSICPTALAIPTQGPLDSFNARTYPACYVEWWFGDGAPGLDRERPMLFEQVARRLINIEEHQYSLPSDTEPYKASCQSRFNNPEIIAVLGDVVRRMRLLRRHQGGHRQEGLHRRPQGHCQCERRIFYGGHEHCRPKRFHRLGQCPSRDARESQDRSPDLVAQHVRRTRHKGTENETTFRRPRQQPSLRRPELLRHTELCRHLQPDRQAPPRWPWR